MHLFQASQLFQQHFNILSEILLLLFSLFFIKFVQKYFDNRFNMHRLIFSHAGQNNFSLKLD